MLKNIIARMEKVERWEIPNSVRSIKSKSRRNLTEQSASKSLLLHMYAAA
jgi:hypothetical protein